MMDDQNSQSIGRARIDVDPVLDKDSLAEQVREAIEQGFAEFRSSPVGGASDPGESGGDREDAIARILEQKFDDLIERIENLIPTPSEGEGDEVEADLLPPPEEIFDVSEVDTDAMELNQLVAGIADRVDEIAERLLEREDS